MHYHLFGAKTLSQQCSLIVNGTHGIEHVSVKFESKLNFIEGNEIDNVVCKLVAILSEPQHFKLRLELISYKCIQDIFANITAHIPNSRRSDTLYSQQM